MTTSIPSVQAVSVLDPRLSQQRGFWSVGLAPSQVNHKRLAATSTSPSGLSFSIFPSNNTSTIDRDILLETKVRLEFTGQGSGTDFLLGKGTDAPRGLAPIIQSINANINGQSYDILLSRLYEIFNMYGNKEERGTWATVTPTTMARDNTQSYTDSYLTVRNPLSAWGDSSFEDTGRGCYPFTVISNTNTSAVVECVFYEHLYMRPFTTSNTEISGLTRIQNIDLNINFAPWLARCWTHSEAAGAVINDATVTFSDSYVHVLELSQVAPMVQELPPFIAYNYAEWVSTTTSFQSSIASLGTQRITSNNYQLSVVPHCVYIYAMERLNDKLGTIRSQVSKPDAYASILNVSIQNYNVTSTQLSGASQVDLYRIAQSNGLNLCGFHDFVGETTHADNRGPPVRIPLVGSMLKLDFGKDIQQSNISQVSGSAINSNFNVDVTIKNVSSTTKFFDLYVVFEYASMMTIENNTSTKMLTVQTPSMALGNAVSAPVIESAGSGIDSDKKRTGWRRFVTPALDIAQSVGNVLMPQYSPAINATRGLIKGITGYGVSGGCTMEGGELQGGMLDGGGVRGGRSMSRKSLKDRY